MTVKVAKAKAMIQAAEEEAGGSCEGAADASAAGGSFALEILERLQTLSQLDSLTVESLLERTGSLTMERTGAVIAPMRVGLQRASMRLGPLVRAPTKRRRWTPRASTFQVASPDGSGTLHMSRRHTVAQPMALPQDKP